MSRNAKGEHGFPNLLSVEEVAKVLKVGVHTVRRLCTPDKDTGAVQIPSLRIGSQLKIAEHDLWVYLKQQRQTSANQVARRERSGDLVVPVVQQREGDRVTVDGEPEQSLEDISFHDQ